MPAITTLGDVSLLFNAHVAARNTTRIHPIRRCRVRQCGVGRMESTCDVYHKAVSIEFFVFGRISCSETGGFARRHSVTKTDELFGHSEL